MMKMKSAVKAVSVVCNTDIAWAAGFFDGEGTTSLLKAQRDTYSYIRMGVSQKLHECLDKFHSIVQHGKIYSSNTRDIRSWNCYKHDDVIDVLNLLWPYLSTIKKQQALETLDKVTNNKKVSNERRIQDITTRNSA